VGVDGALVGGVEMDDGVIAGAAAGEAWGGELMADGERDGLLFPGTGEDPTGELAEGEIVGDGAWDGGVEIDEGVTTGAWDGGVEIDDGVTTGAWDGG